MTFDDYLVRWSVLHGGATVTMPIRMWLRFTFVLAHPLRKFHPNVITMLGLVVAGLTLACDFRLHLPSGVLAPLILMLGVIDSLDGIVATITDRNSPFGAFLDSLVDRIVDVSIALLLFNHGAPLAAVLATICLTLLHEYMRARASGLSVTEVGVITVGEKPTRIAIGVMFFLACAVMNQHTELLVSLAADIWCAISLVACIQLFTSIKHRLLQG